MDSIRFYVGTNTPCEGSQYRPEHVDTFPATAPGGAIRFAEGMDGGLRDIPRRAPAAPMFKDSSLSCPLCPGKGPWQRRRALISHVVSAAHLENEMAVERHVNKHPQFEQWQRWKEDVGLPDILRDAFAQETKQGHTLRLLYNCRRQLLEGRLQNNLSAWTTPEGLLTDDYEFGTHASYDLHSGTRGTRPGPTGISGDTEASSGVEVDIDDLWAGSDASAGDIGDDIDIRLGSLRPGSKFLDSFERALNRELDVEFASSLNTDDLSAANPSNAPGEPLKESPFDQPCSWFTPCREEDNMIDYHPPNPWYPFESEIFARLFVFVNCRTNPLSRQQLLRVWDLLGRFSRVPVPSFSAVVNFVQSIPRPRTYEMQTEEPILKSYSQISITDVIRMQLAIPETHRLLQQQSILIQRHKGSPSNMAPTVIKDRGEGLRDVRRELWTGSKWHLTPSLQPPNVLLESGEEAWFGMILQFPSAITHSCAPGTSPTSQVHHSEYGLFCGQSLWDLDGSTTHRLHYYPLPEIRQGLVFADPNLEIDQKMIRYVDRLRVTTCFQASFPSHLGPVSDGRPSAIYTLSSNPAHAQQLTLPSRESFDRVFGPHPVLVNRNKISPQLPVEVVNISLWQDGLSGNASNKWNPHEACIMSLAGLPREITDTVFGNHFIAVARDTKGIHLLDGVVQELNRLQRGILAWNAGMNRLSVITGSIVQLKVDNPAASDLCNHMWKSNFPCRLCLFTTAKMTKMRVLDTGIFRNPETSLAILESLNHQSAAAAKKGENGLQAKDRVSPLFSILGFDPFRDTPWEKLHSFLLGPAKEATRALLKLAPIVAVKDEIRMFIDAMNWDNINGRLAGRRVMQWSGSFVGYDYKVFLQIAPFLLTQFLSPTPGMPQSLRTSYLNLHKLFVHLAELNNLVYLSNIDDLHQWTMECERLTQKIVEGFEQWRVTPDSKLEMGGTGSRDHGKGSKAQKATAPARRRGRPPKNSKRRCTRVGIMENEEPEAVNAVGTPGQSESEGETQAEIGGERFPVQDTLAIAPGAGPGLNTDIVVNFNKKLKFHLLAHIPYWVERFGPPRNSHTETEEHLNSVIRDKLHHSNRQGPSIDTARRFSTLEGITFMSRGGIWRHPKKEMMTTAGSGFLRMMSSDPLWREMGGLTTVEITDSDANEELRPGDTTLSNPGKLIRRNLDIETLQYVPDRSLFLTIGLVSADLWDSGRIADNTIVRSKSFVQDQEGITYRILRIYRGCLQPNSEEHYEGDGLGSQPAGHGIQTFFTVRQFISAGASASESDLLGCPAFYPTDLVQVFHSSEVKKLVNIQHLCGSKCGIRYDEKAWMVERRAVGGKVWGHSEDGVFLLNRFGLGTVTGVLRVEDERNS